MSAAPSRARQASESAIQRDRPKTIVAAPNTPTAASILTPTSCFSGRKEKKIAVSVAPTAGAARRWPRPVGAGVEDVAREDRQHRGRAAEQDREQVERDRAEHQLVLADVAQAVDHLVPGMLRALDRGARLGPDQEHAERATARTGRRRPHKAACGAAGVEIAADRRPGDRARSARRSSSSRSPWAGSRAARGWAPAPAAPASAKARATPSRAATANRASRLVAAGPGEPAERSPRRAARARSSRGR